jgi:hypothetical protein
MKGFSSVKMHLSSCALFSPSRALFVQSCPCPRLGTTGAPLGANTKIALKIGDERSINRVASSRGERYCPPVAANSATGFGDPNTTRRTGAPITIAGAFFVPAYRVYGGCAWETFGSAGFRVSRFANPRIAATLIRLATNRGSSESTHGATLMTIIIPPAIRLAAHKAMALAALRANSSLSVRLKRYNHHIAQARALEAQGGAQ